MKARRAHIFAKERHGLSARATAHGTAGEHLVCADLLLNGYLAFQSAQGLPYDIILDVGDQKLLRIAVKSSYRASKRPAREGSRLCYQFSVTRPRRLRSGKSDARPVTAEHADIVAFVALDIRRVAYSHISECAQSMHFDPPGTPFIEGRAGQLAFRFRKTFEVWTIGRALGVARGEIKPFPFKWRAA